MAEHVREHYNKHANKHETAQQALAERARGVAAPLKKFHNEIKRALLQRFAAGADTLLDYACGRGGDIRKWADAKVGFVKGIDLSPAEIQEAQRRYDEVKRQMRDCPDIVFEASDQLGSAEVREKAPFQVVTCMFAIHYFFAASEMLDRFLTNVATNLEPGGYFIGTVPDGKRIAAHLTKAKGAFTSPCLNLTQKFEGKPPPFGAEVVFEIKDTVVEGHEDGASAGSHEFLVFQSVLEKAAAAHGLHPVRNYQDPRLEGMFAEKDNGEWAKHFKPPFADPKSLALASSLYMAFVFQKVDQPDQACAPEPEQQQQRLKRRRDEEQEQAPSVPPGRRRDDRHEGQAPPAHLQQAAPHHRQQRPYPPQQPPPAAGSGYHPPGPMHAAPGGYGPPPTAPHVWPAQVVPPAWPQGSRYNARWGVPTTTAAGEPTTLPSAWLLTKFPEGRAGRFMVPEWVPSVAPGPFLGEDYGYAQEQEKQRAVMEREAKREAQQRKAAAGLLGGHHHQQQQPPQQQPVEQPSSSRPPPTGERSSNQPAADPCGYAAATPAVSIPAAVEPAGLPPGPGYA